MFKHLQTCMTMAGLVVIAAMSLGCDRNQQTPTQPTLLSHSPVVVAPEPATPLTVTSISPTIGSTDGTQVTIIGTGFSTGARATIGGIPIGGYAWQGTFIFGSTQAHAAGNADVVVTNPGGETVTLPGAYTYVSPDTFEVNGTWIGWADSNYMTPFQFTVQDNTVISVSCNEAPPLTFSPPLPVVHGAFSFHGAGRDSMTGRIVAPNWALGDINITAFCADGLVRAYPWTAERQ